MYIEERKALLALYETGKIDFDEFKACNEALDEYEKI